MGGGGEGHSDISCACSADDKGGRKSLKLVVIGLRGHNNHIRSRHVRPTSLHAWCKQLSQFILILHWSNAWISS